MAGPAEPPPRFRNEPPDMPARPNLPCLGLALFLGAPAALAGPIVNIESQRFEDPPEGWSGHLDASLSGESGNQTTFQSTASARLDHLDRERQWILLAARKYGRSGREADVDESLLHLRRVAPRGERWAVEAFGQAERNPFRRLEYRALAGSGVRLGAYTPTGDQRIHVGLGAFAEREREETEEGPQRSDTLRGNFYWNHRMRTDTGVDLSQTLYAQPALDDPEDYRLLNQFSATSPLSRRLDLQFALTIRYDNRPPPQVRRTDTSYSLSLRWRFAE